MFHLIARSYNVRVSLFHRHRYKKYVLQADNSVVISKLTSDLNDDTEFDTDDVVVLRKMLVGIEEYEFDSNAVSFPAKSIENVDSLEFSCLASVVSTLESKPPDNIVHTGTSDINCLFNEFVTNSLTLEIVVYISSSNDSVFKSQ